MSKIIKNMIKSINNNSMNSIKEELLENNKILLVELDGSKIQSWVDYITEIQSNFKFPTQCLDSIDRYLDWIRDLEWLEYDGFTIVINNYYSFCKDNPKTKSEIIKDFEQTILPYWQDEVKNITVGGIAKSFMVYLVD